MAQGIRISDLQDTPELQSAPPLRKRSALAKWLPLGILLAVTLAALSAIWLSGGISFETLAQHSTWLQEQVAASPLIAGIALFLSYLAVTALSLPFASLVTVLAGFLFGTALATFWVVAGATAGSLVVYFAARGPLHETFMKRASGWLKRMEKGFNENAFSYLLFLRLLPVFPFWLVNLVPALLGVRWTTFLVATGIGIIPGVLVYAALGSGLGDVIDAGQTPDLTIILQPNILLPLAGLALISLLPIVVKRFRRKQAPSPQQ